jgi:hypothetical protein
MNTIGIDSSQSKVNVSHIETRNGTRVTSVNKLHFFALSPSWSLSCDPPYTITDTFFDVDARGVLMSNGIWIKQRSGIFYVKCVSDSKTAMSPFLSYREDVCRTRSELEVVFKVIASQSQSKRVQLLKTVNVYDLKPFCTLKFRRSKFQSGVVRDDMLLDDQVYSVYSYVRSVAPKQDEQMLRDVVQQLGDNCTLSLCRSKIVQYLKHHRPLVFKHLLSNADVLPVEACEDNYVPLHRVVSTYQACDSTYRWCDYSRAYVRRVPSRKKASARQIKMWNDDTDLEGFE